MDDTEKILDFIQEHLKYHDRDLMREYINEHRKYGTFDYAIDTQGNIVSMCRWNISDDFTLAYVLDFAIAKEWRNKRVGTNFIVRAMMKFPKIEKLVFKRGVRGDERTREISIKGIFRHNIF